MADLITKYCQLVQNNQRPELVNYELELRLGRVLVDRFAKLYARMQGLDSAPTLEKSFDFSYQETELTRTITKVTFKGSEKADTFYVRKDEIQREKIAAGSDTKGYSLVLASETLLSKNPSAGLPTIRVKARVSFTHLDWRFDFTLLHPCGQMSDAKRIREEWLDQITLSNFIEIATASSMTCNFEIEAEYVGKPKDNIKLPLDLIVFSSTSESMLVKISELLSLKTETNIKSMASRPVTLLRHVYNEIYPATGWYLTHKADGHRGFLLSDSSGAYTVSEEVVRLPDSATEKALPAFVVDGEMMENGSFICHDILYLGKSLLNLTFAVRLEALFSIRARLNTFPNVFIKEFFPIDQDIAMSVERAKVDPGFPIDGHLLIGPDRDYYSTLMYKIKPVNTIDFLAVKCPMKMMGRPPYIRRDGKILYLLFCTSSSHVNAQLKLTPLAFFRELFTERFTRTMPQHFTPPDNPLAYLFYSDVNFGDREFVELSRDVAARDWRFHKIRSDRAKNPGFYGNFISIAVAEWSVAHDPITLDSLIAASSDYFKTARDSFYDKVVRVNSMVKKASMAQVVNSSTVALDLGSGRGQDISRYCGARHVTFSDKDRAALIELIERRYTIESRGNDRRQSKACAYPFSVFVTDYSDIQPECATVLKSLAPAPYNLAVCNFAIHYFVHDVPSYGHFVNFIDSLGIETFVYTCFSKDRIEALTAEGEWNASENDRLKYSIRREDGKVSLILPFSAGRYYTENLVDLTRLNKMFKAAKFQVESRSFTECEGYNPAGLTDADKTFVGLYYLNVCKKVGKKGGRKSAK
jgi:hypothetical protein